MVMRCKEKWKIESMVNLSIIIVNYNSEPYLVDCIKSIEQHTQSISYEILIINNSMPTKTLSDLQNGDHHIRIIQNEENLGFGSAVNQGFKVAEGKYYLVLNPDTILYKDVLDKLCVFFDENPEVHIATIRIGEVGTKHKLQTSFWKKYSITFTLLNSFLHINGKLGSGYFLMNINKPKRVDIVSGAFMFIKKMVIDAIGGFDENIFLYSEDTELCIRAKKNGFNVYYLPFEGILHHNHGSSTSKPSIILMALKNRFYILKKHYHPIHYFPIKYLSILSIFYQALIFFILKSLTRKEKFFELQATYQTVVKEIIKNRFFIGFV